MTKQQQQKIDKVNKALETMNKGATLNEASSIVGYSRPDKLRRALKELDYVEYKGNWIKVSEDCNTRSNTNSNTEKNEVVLVENNQISLPHDIIDLLQEEQGTVKAMIDWYKVFSNTCNTSNTIMKIELPQSENVMISTRSNKVVWEKFKTFCKNHSANFTMGDLVAAAFLEYMEKYK